MCMGFLWCKGTKQEKADFLFDIMIDPVLDAKIEEFKRASSMKSFDMGMYADDSISEHEPILVWTSQQLTKVFDRLFKIAMDLPIDPAIKDEMTKLSILNESELRKNIFIWR